MSPRERRRAVHKRYSAWCNRRAAEAEAAVLLCRLRPGSAVNPEMWARVDRLHARWAQELERVAQ